MSDTVETPSGKQARDENFPVGSWLLPASLRPHVAIFYAYARAIDDIADDPDLAPAEKISRLDGFADALRDPGGANPAFARANAIRDSMAATHVDPQHCLDLIAAFKQDAVKSRYADWDDLMAYCMLSAAPVGRYLIDLHGETKDAYAASDALCCALQVINHLQDCQDDYRALDRVYLPGDWMSEAGITVASLDGAAASAGLRRVIDQSLDSTETLMAVAESLIGRLRNTRFALEAAVIVRIANRLTQALRRRDPLAERVVLRRPQYILCGMGGLWDVVRRSG
ncbi:MAG: squalene synthase HpnC [Alphaproteobacteria bacterium]